MSNANKSANCTKSDIYENLPCDRKRDSETMDGGTEAVAKAVKPQTKESLYATPLRKSERPNGKSNSNSSRSGTAKAREEKRSSGSTSQSNKSSSTRKSGGEKAMIPNQDPILEQRRMRNFLNDQAPPVTPNHKNKADPAVQMNANFSSLAQEEHFANLVHQNVLNTADNKEEAEAEEQQRISEEVEEANGVADETVTMDELEDEKCLKNLELLTQKAAAAVQQESQLKRRQEEQAAGGNLANGEGEEPEPLFLLPVNRVEIPPERMFIRREWALKKILICLEQRTNKRGGTSELAEGQLQGSGNNNLPHLGALVLGSNGSGKTTICQSILDGGNGTKGILNRRLLCCYLISSQNPECHSISIFIRSLVLQILSHSSYLFRDEEPGTVQDVPGDRVRDTGEVRKEREAEEEEEEEEEKRDERKSETGAVGTNSVNSEAGDSSTVRTEESGGKLSRLTSEKIKELEEMLISELQSAGHGSPLMNRKQGIVRQQSEPVTKEEAKDKEKLQFGSNPALNKIQGTPKKISKIPVKIGGSCRGSPKISLSNEENLSGDKVKEDVENQDKGEAKQEAGESREEVIESKPEASEEKPQENLHVDEEEEEEEKSASVSAAPPPLPKIKDCRTIIADAYYELLMSNPEILESLSVDCIEKNPDECFKKVILFPLLELNPPKSSLLFLIDSIDEHYITESSLISTLKRNKNSTGSSGVSAATVVSNKSQNIAELLAQHVHLLPKWLFLVCTGKKQNKHITKLFSGFKKITIDDLRKSHVVKDVQEYIILRLNTDFRNAINLTKDVIDSLNQLYLKSNGCILYLQKVMNGIKEGFFTFREIKMLPCSLNGLYLYICQKLFNKKQFQKIRPILNVLLAVPQVFVERDFVWNCLRTQCLDLDEAEFDARLKLMQHVLVFDQDGQMLRIFHNSFADWLIDVKFSTKKFLCDANEGHVMIAMYYAWISERLCANVVRRFVYHLIKAGEYLQQQGQPLDLVLFLLETRANLSDCFYTNSLNCCRSCELSAKGELNLNQPRTRQMLSNYIDKALRNEQLQQFLGDFFKPNLPTDGKSLKLLIETGINNADTQVSKVSREFGGDSQKRR